MIFLGYFVQYKEPFWKWPSWATPESGEFVFPPPIQVAGPIIFGIGTLLVLIGIISSLMTSQFLNEKLRHYHHRGQPASVTVYTTHTQQPRAIYTPDPYQPLPPPAYPVLRNKYAVGAVIDPQAEMKLYPPVYADCLLSVFIYKSFFRIPGCSTLALHGRSPVFLGSPYNTLKAASMTKLPQSPSQGEDLGTTFTNYRAGSAVASRRQSSITSLTVSQRRARSVGSHLQSRYRKQRESQND